MHWILYRDGIELQRLPYVEGEPATFDVDSRGTRSRYSVKLELGARPPGPFVTVSATFTREPRQSLDPGDARS